MNIFENLEKLQISEECFDDIMDIVEDIVSTAQKNLENAENRENKYVKRIQKVVSAKKESGTLPDEKFGDKVLNKLINGKYRRSTEKAAELVRKAEKLPKSNDYLKKGDEPWYTNLSKKEKDEIRNEDKANYRVNPGPHYSPYDVD